MEKKLDLAKDRLAFLVEQTQFSPADMQLNTQTFTWHGRMDSIFEEHRAIAAEKRVQYEDALKVSDINWSPSHPRPTSGLPPPTPYLPAGLPQVRPRPIIPSR